METCCQRDTAAGVGEGRRRKEESSCESSLSVSELLEPKTKSIPVAADSAVA